MKKYIKIYWILLFILFSIYCVYNMIWINQHDISNAENFIPNSERSIITENMPYDDEMTESTFFHFFTTHGYYGFSQEDIEKIELISENQGESIIAITDKRDINFIFDELSDKIFTNYLQDDIDWNRSSTHKLYSMKIYIDDNSKEVQKEMNELLMGRGTYIKISVKGNIRVYNESLEKLSSTPFVMYPQNGNEIRNILENLYKKYSCTE